MEGERTGWSVTERFFSSPHFDLVVDPRRLGWVVSPETEGSDSLGAEQESVHAKEL